MIFIENIINNTNQFLASDNRAPHKNPYQDKLFFLFKFYKKNTT